MEKKIKYSNGELTIVWQPAVCIHSGVCVRALPLVYRPNERPWIKIENATTQELMSQIDQCPSGALSYRLTEKKDTLE
ncbi:(4Fe-4S)-binding protein [Dysgonomonas sp. 520]|uniref:(4Fe-4S)-binding protein n=1 Tax=Dysgonomonas sp. 520 TaxID=2302931 RepID=UPI0013D3AB4B|nr:(4Fe-4S)-binding protein [Dysgonomonas sp. 520]NDW08133.1 (4Fe-4S)-binding protein [Dysgonomonas sp. 520]